MRGLGEVRIESWEGGWGMVAIERTKEREMMVFRPAAMFVNLGKCTLGGLGWFGSLRVYRMIARVVGLVCIVLGLRAL